MALTDDANVGFKSGQGEFLSLPMDKAAQTIYKGSLVVDDTSGAVVAGADTSGYDFVGIAEEKVSYAAADAADGDHSIRVRRTGVALLYSHSTITATNLGEVVFVYDSEKIALVGDVTHLVHVGRIVKIEDATLKKVWVELTPSALAGSAAELETDLASVSNEKGAYKIGVEDAADWLTAAQAEAAIAELAAKEECMVFNIAGAIGHAARIILDDWEFVNNVTVTRIYMTCETAPGGAYVCTATLTDGANPKTCTITGAATKGEDEAVDQAYAKDTDMTLSIVDDNASGATADVTVMIWWKKKKG